MVVHHKRRHAKLVTKAKYFNLAKFACENTLNVVSGIENLAKIT